MPEVQVLHERIRGCGYRKQGLYLMGPLHGEPCERLPFPITGGWPKFSRSWLEINPSWLFDTRLEPVCIPTYPGHNHNGCPVCTPPDSGHYLMWVGKQHYTPQSFLEEAAEMGISKRIAFLPDGFEFGMHWVFLAHLEGHFGGPGVFCAFKPSHIDYVVDDENNIPEQAERLAEQYGDRLRIVKVIPDDEPKD